MMLWEETARLPDWRQVAALLAPDQADSDRNWAASFANRSRRLRGRGRYLPGHANTQFAVSSRETATPFFFPIDRYDSGGYLV